MLVDQRTEALPFGQIFTRGLAAAHSVLLGAVLLFLLHAPDQVLNAVTQGFQAQVMSSPPNAPEPLQLLLYLAAAGGSFVAALAAFFLFPLVLGGILGQVRDRLESPEQPPGQFAAYGRGFYVRLLGSQGLFTLVLLGILLPMMCAGMMLAFQEIQKTMPDMPAEGVPAPQPLDTQQFTRQFFAQPAVLAGMAISLFLVTAVGMVYWVANAIVVSEHEPVIASWRKALHFCRQNLPAVLVMGLLNVAAGVLSSPVSLAGQLGIVKDPWALLGLALVYSALIGYWGVLLAGLSMSLYVGRRQPPVQCELEPTALACVPGTREIEE